MALLEDKISEIRDPELRQTIAEEVRALKQQKQFGIVFETHQPEVIPVFNVPIRARSTVATRTGNLAETYRVRRIQGHTAYVTRHSDDTEHEIPVDSLVVVRRMGEPVYPSLSMLDAISRAPNHDSPAHLIIEGENYHALQLLEYTYAGQVDCIYIDPPYNTGARDWKYNNDYVDRNDGWRHSKWLSMMERRLRIATRLLKPTGVMCITIDDYEGHRLKSLLDDRFKELDVLGTAVIKNNPAGRTTTRGFAVSHEYAIFVGKSEAHISRLERTPEQMARYKERDETGQFEWTNFRKHGGKDTYRKTRPRQFYPIYVVGDEIRIPRMEWNEGKREWKTLDKPRQGETVLWPINDRGEERIWDFGVDTARQELEHLRVAPDSNNELAIYRKWRVTPEGLLPLTWWDKSLYSAAEYGTNLLTKLFDAKHVFPFPKSVYAVRDCLWVAGADSPTALIVDFFAGSGTTLHSVLQLNAVDHGTRQCVLVTNNDVGEETARALLASGHRPGDKEWEEQGICRSVTFPRARILIRGSRDDSAQLTDDYLTGRRVTKQRQRTIRRIGSLDGSTLRAGHRREIAALLTGVPQSRITNDTPWFIDPDVNTSILWNGLRYEEWLADVAAHPNVIDLVAIVADNKLFRSLKAHAEDVLPSVDVEEDERRHFSDGFDATATYLKLDFLDPAEVAMGQQFKAIFPILWMIAGARGTLPTLGRTSITAPWIIPRQQPFGILLDETKFRGFSHAIHKSDDIELLFLVTNSTEAFHDMRSALPSTLRCIQLYKNYLENFAINGPRL
jgi:adenine-specific DNA-methyltransferase